MAAGLSRVDHHGMKDLPVTLRPREKLIRQGPQALADAELLALLLRTGVRGAGVLQLAQSLLDRFGGLSPLLHAEPAMLGDVKGLGPAKRAELQAVMELARRALRAPLAERPVLDAPLLVRDYLRARLQHLGHEVFMVLFLDSQLRLVACEELFRGTLNQAAVYPREVVQRALTWRAAAVILAHNHPSGVAEPSRADEYLTQTLKSALALIDTRVIDHLVVGQGQIVSFAERGLL